MFHMHNTRALVSTANFLFTVFCCVVADAQETADRRVTDGLQVLYDFADIEEGRIKDRSGSESGVDLRIDDLESVNAADGILQVLKPATIRSAGRPNRLMKAIRQSGALSLEAWVKPKDARQKGPARIITLSKNASERNFTLGQDQSRFDVRLRTTKTSRNGIPSTASPERTLSSKVTHVVFTRHRNGSTRIYVNGSSVEENKVTGNFSSWDDSLYLNLANEVTGDRPWLGALHLVAIYSRALSAAEVKQNYDVGPEGQPSPERLAERQRTAAARFFETAVAPILADRCVECHDSATRGGGLDLSKKVAALQGSDDGPVILPGRAAKSPLWAAVESDSMPLDRSPLSGDEKQTLKKWIDDGAMWSLNEIDPAVYQHGGTNPNFVQRLTIEEYIETVQAAVGVNISREAREILPADLRADGFTNTAYNLGVDLKHVDAYARLAEIIVSRMDVLSFVSKFSKKQKFTDKAMGSVIGRIGKWLLRGPLEEREINAFRGITTAVAGAGGSYEEAMRYVIESMLQSPRFIYRVENQRGDGSPTAVSEYELASRISYIVWGGPPDRPLMKAADEGRLGLNDIDQHVQRMLSTPRAKRHSKRFVADWLNLQRLQNLRPDTQRFPNWNPQLAEDMRKETLAYFEDVVWTQNQPLSALLNTQVTFVTPTLARFYDLPQASEQRASSDGLRKYDLTPVTGRGGLLTQASVLTIGGDNASMVTRGLMVMHELLRGVVKDPPPCVDTTPVATSPGKTQRSIAMARIANPNCGGCHGRFEPLAFGLEKFDGIGAYHDKDEHGNKLRDDGKLLIPGDAEVVSFESSAELMNLLAESERVSQSLTWKITQFSLGRPLLAEDASIVDTIHKAAQENGGTWSAVIRAIIASDLVQKTNTETSGTPEVSRTTPAARHGRS